MSDITSTHCFDPFVASSPEVLEELTENGLSKNYVNWQFNQSRALHCLTKLNQGLNLSEPMASAVTANERLRDAAGACAEKIVNDECPYFVAAKRVGDADFHKIVRRSMTEKGLFIQVKVFPPKSSI